jgi:hypothetical protein
MLPMGVMGLKKHLACVGTIPEELRQGPEDGWHHT